MLPCSPVGSPSTPASSPGLRPFDPFPFVMLAMAASVEAIFLSTFVLISQNRMAELADKRADLDLQINLLSEHEITRLVKLLDAVAKRLGIPTTRARAGGTQKGRGAREGATGD